MLASLLNKRSMMNEELRAIEYQVHEMETSYLQDPSQCGNVLEGFEGFLSASKSTPLLKRSRKLHPEDRLFSLSSITSPAMGRSDLGGGRSKGSVYANGQFSKRKLSNTALRRRPTPRDAKEHRSSDQDFDYEDDHDLTS